MRKKQIAVVALVFVAGFIIGGLAVTSYFGKSLRNTGQILLLEQRADWERRAFQAYSQKNPQVAIWALENLADVLRKQVEVAGNDRDFIQKDLVLTYARLAIASRAAKDKQKYDQNISKALSLAKQVYSAKLRTEEGLFTFVKKLDNSAKK
jgi:hypothetical protein